MQVLVPPLVTRSAIGATPLAGTVISSGATTSSARSQALSASTSSRAVPKLVSNDALMSTSDPAIAAQPSGLAATPTIAPYSSVGSRKSPKPAAASGPSRLLNAAAAQ